MKKFSFKLPLYGQIVTLVQIERKEDADQILPILKDVKLSQEDIQQTIDEIKRGCFNGGDTYRNFEIERILVVFFLMKSEKMRANIYAHEKRHIEDRVLEWAGVDDIEASAFLSGFLGEKFYEFTQLVTQKQYIRFGELPKGEESGIYRGEECIGKEVGTSVYPAIVDKKGIVSIGITLPITSSTLATLTGFLQYDNRRCFLVTGERVGVGTDGEPLLKNVKTIKEIKYRHE